MLSEHFYQSTLNFPSQSVSPNYEPPKTPITETQLILDILYTLLGMPGSILSQKSNTQQYELSARYQMSHLMSGTMQSAVKECVRLCSQVRYIESQGKRLYAGSGNATVRTFCEAVFNYLQQTKQQYSLILSQTNSITETQKVKPTLLTLSKLLSNRNYMIGFLIRCLNSCFIEQERKGQVVRLLDKMWEIEQEIILMEGFQRDALVGIFRRTLGCYFRGVRDWLKMSKIGEQMGFFINMEDSKKNSEYFLHRNDEIDPLKLPKLIENQSEGILEIGKTIRFISLYYEDFEQEKLMNYLDIDGEFQVLTDTLKVEQTITFSRVKREKITLNDRIRNRNRKQNTVAKQTVPQENPFQMFSKESHSFNINWIEKRKSRSIEEVQPEVKGDGEFCFLFHIKCLLLQILQAINKKCLHFFRNTHDTLVPTRQNRIQTSLSNTLLGIKRFMLLQQGDFLEEFFNAAADIIDRQKKEISHNRIYGCIDQAIENSSAKNLPKEILQNVHFDYIKGTDERNQKLRLWVLFSFNYRQDKDNPINYIFTNAMMDRLKEVCNFIIKVKKSQSVLTKIWNEQRESKARRSQSRLEKKQRILRNSLSCYINSILSYTLLKIDLLWSDYKEKLSSASTVFQLITESTQIVQSLQKCSTQDKLLFNSTMQCLMLVDKYRKLHNLMRDPTLIIPVKEVDLLEFQLKSIVEVGVKIPGFGDFVSYNGYFDQFQ